MIRSRLLALTAALGLLAGCGGHKDAAADEAANQATAEENMTMEDVPSDSLAAPADTPMGGEGNAADGGENGM